MYQLITVTTPLPPTVVLLVTLRAFADVQFAEVSNLIKFLEGNASPANDFTSFCGMLTPVGLFLSPPDVNQPTACCMNMAYMPTTTVCASASSEAKRIKIDRWLFLRGAMSYNSSFAQL